jgi:Trk-type K+ transport system membrane component|tara:strand:+ start:1997 stop:2317 length:321 start_codon:yes stop_codon:yes gene_type:complete
MAGKKLAKDSKYAQYDTDGDGIVTDDEMAQAERMIEIENKDKKEDQLRQMAWVAMLSMVVFTVALFLPMLSVERLSALDNLLSMFYIAQAGVVATFFGSSAYMSKN